MAQVMMSSNLLISNVSHYLYLCYGRDYKLYLPMENNKMIIFKRGNSLDRTIEDLQGLEPQETTRMGNYFSFRQFIDTVEYKIETTFIGDKWKCSIHQNRNGLIGLTLYYEPNRISIDIMKGQDELTIYCDIFHSLIRVTIEDIYEELS